MIGNQYLIPILVVATIICVMILIEVLKKPKDKKDKEEEIDDEVVWEEQQNPELKYPIIKRYIRVDDDLIELNDRIEKDSQENNKVDFENKLRNNENRKFLEKLSKDSDTGDKNEN